MKELVQKTSLLTGSIMFLSFANIYYSFFPFGIRIFYYIDFNDAILSFLEVILKAIIFLFITLVFQFFCRPNLKRLRPIDYYFNFIITSKKYDRLNKRTKKALKLAILFHYYFLALLTATVCIIFLETGVRSEFLFSCCFVSIFFLFIPIVNRLYKTILIKKGVGRSDIAFGLMIIFFVVYSFVLNLNMDVDGSTYQSGKNTFMLTYKGKLIKSDTSLYYIGMTKNYLFLRTRKKETVVLNRNNVDSLVFK